MTYESFIYNSWSFDPSNKTLSLHYSFDDALHFTETYVFDFPFSTNLNSALINQACQTLFLMAGVSYYKAYPSKTIRILQGTLDQTGAEFFAKTFRKGLGEYFYVNRLDPNTVIPFPAAGTQSPVPEFTAPSGMLVSVGGGKDSLVSVELLRGKDNLATWSLNHREQLAPLIQRIGLPHFQVERTIDSSLFELNDKGALNGHVPISAIIACAGTIVALLAGYHDVVMSNEATADEPTLTYNGVAINHQYSKSSEFEREYQAYLAHTLGDAVRYYSLLRPFTELRIAEMFAQTGFSTYKDVFSSCNRAFTHDSHAMFWCGSCAKCAFIFLALTPFIERSELEQLWNGKNLLLSPELESTYRQLLGIEGDKPLDCVGEIKESRAAMRMAQSVYPELARYQFELPDGYDFRATHKHSIPKDLNI